MSRPAATITADSTTISTWTGKKKVSSIPPPNEITTTPAARHIFLALIAMPPNYKKMDCRYQIMQFCRLGEKN